MKQMKYQRKWTRETLDSGKIGEYEYTIMSLGTHPVAYIKIPDEYVSSIYGKRSILDNVLVHGGITYQENELIMPEGIRKGYYIGWDYMHAGDYLGINEVIDLSDIGINPKELKKWSTEEILEEVHGVCKQLDVLLSILQIEKE